MPRELSDFYVDVLAELGVADSARTASAEDHDVVEDAYPAVWEMLHDRGLVTWALADDIPERALIPMRWIVAFHVAAVFGIVGDKRADMQQKGQLEGPTPSLGERMLRKMVAVEGPTAPVAVDYY